MPVAVECGHCRTRFAAPDQLVGRTVKCPSCGHAITVGSGTPSPSVPARTAPQRAPVATAPGRPAAMGASWSKGTPAPVPKKTSMGLIIGLVAGGAGLLVVAIVAVVLVIVFSGKKPNDVADGSDGATPGSSASNASDSQGTAATGSNNSSSPSNAGAAAGWGIQPQTNSPSASSPSNTFGQPLPGQSTGQTPNQTEGGSSNETTGTRNSSSSTRGNTTGNSSSGQASVIIGLNGWWQAGEVTRGVTYVDEDRLVILQYSWMTELLPHLGYQNLYDKLDRSKIFGEGRANIEVATEPIPQFLNPNDPRIRYEGLNFEGLALTHFVGMSGLETTRNTTAAMLPRSDDRAGIFAYAEMARPEQVTDGTSNTIMVIGSGLLAGPWISGGGATIRGARAPYFDALTGFGSRGTSPAGTLVVLADGSVRLLPADIDPTVFQAMCTIHGGESVDIGSATKPANDWSTRKRRDLD